MRKPGEPLPVETLPRDELEKLQNKRLRYTLRQAYEHTLFWHEKFDSLGIRPEDIKNKEDLLKAYEKGLKVTDEDLIFSFGKLLPDYLEKKGYILLTTSGTSGIPKQIPHTLDDFNRTNHQCFLVYNSMGVSRRSKVLNAFAPPPNASGIFILKSLESIGASQYPLMVEVSYEVEARILESFKPEFLFKLGSKALELGNYLLENGRDPKEMKIKNIGIGGEFFSETLKKKLKRLWNAEVTDVYANAEFCVGGFECSLHEGMHVPEDRIILSLVNDEGEEKGEGEEGRILVSLLYEEGEKPGIFLINKLMGDVSKNLGRGCECRRNTLKISPPRRIDDIFSIESKKFNARDVEELLHYEGFTGNYVVAKYINKEDGKLRKLEVRAEISREVPPPSILLSELIDAFSKTNPLTYELLKKLEKEQKIKVSYRKKGKLYEGLENYIKKGKPVRFIEVIE